MDVQMRHALTSVRTTVDYNAITALVDPKIARHLRRSQNQLPEQLLIRFVSLSQAGNDALRDDQYVDRRLRTHIMKGEHVVILKEDLRWNFPRGDLLEDRHRIEQ